MSSSITSSSPPKRRLSLFSFGNKKNSNSKNNIIGSDNNNTPPSSQSQEQQSQGELNDQQQEQQEHQHHHSQKRFIPDDKARGPHDTDIQLVSPNSPLSLTDENLQNLQNLNNINSLPPPSMSLGTITPTSNSNTQHHHSHHHPHQQQQQQQHSKSVSDTMSESSLIFERYVQDPFPTSPQIPLPQQQQQQQQQSQQSLPNQPFPQRQNSQFFGAPHLTNENFIPLAIDSTTSLIQSNTDLDEVDMIYSPRRSSVLNLSSAFNSPQQPSSRRSSVATNYNANKSPALDRSMSLFTTTTSSQQPPSKSLQPALKQRKSTISFLSYADMIQNEEQDQNIPRRPSMSQTLSSSFLLGPNIPRSRNDSITSSRTPLRQPALFTASPSISRQTSGRSSMMNKLNTQQQQQQPHQQKFQLMPDSPTSESSDNDEMMLPNPKARSLSNASSSHNNGASLCTTKTIDDVLETPEPNEQEPHDIVVSSVGDTLRQYTEDIRSS